jgi:transcriptional regulator GlxA family with amidase domain
MREQKKVQEQRQLQPQVPAGCGQTPHHYLFELRLAKAQALIPADRCR